MPVGALIGAAVVGGAATVYGASKASSAAKAASNDQAAAAAQANELNRYIYDTSRADNEPWRATGQAALSAVSGGFGLPTMTGRPAANPTYASTPVPGIGGVSMTGPSRTSVIGAQGFGGAEDGTAIGGPGMTTRFNDGINDTGATTGWTEGVSPAPPAAGGQTGPDWAAYLQQNPDVAAAVPEGQDPAAFAAQHYEQFGKDENRALPMHPVSAPGSGTPYVAPAGYTDPTAPGGYMTGDRPNLGPGPAPYVAPSRAPEMTRPMTQAADLSEANFRTSPDYQFRVHEQDKALANLAGAMRGRFTGQRVKAAEQRRNDIAGAEYTDWRNFTQGQSNFDRARGDAIFSEDRGRGDAIYSEDRNFGYGQSRDARGDFVVDRSRSDGLFADDRSRNDTRYDVRNQQLMTLAGFGAAANGANASAATTFAQNTNSANMTAANAKGDARIAGANAWNQGFGNLMTTGAYLGGQYLSGGFGGGSLPKTYNI